LKFRFSPQGKKLEFASLDFYPLDGSFDGPKKYIMLCFTFIAPMFKVGVPIPTFIRMNSIILKIRLNEFILHRCFEIWEAFN